MLKRWQNFNQDKPLQAWLISAALPALFYLALLCTRPGPTNPGLVLLFVSLTLSQPIRSLVQRFSEKQRREHPIAPGQEVAVGAASLLASLSSMCALCVVALGKPLGLLLTTATDIWLLMLFSVSLALALSYAVRDSWSGRWGLRLSFGWLLLIVFAAAGLFLRHL